MIECRINGQQHVIYMDSDGLFTDLVAEAYGEETLVAAAGLSEAYADLAGYEWPENYSSEFDREIAALIRA